MPPYSSNLPLVFFTMLCFVLNCRSGFIILGNGLHTCIHKSPHYKNCSGLFHTCIVYCSFCCRKCKFSIFIYLFCNLWLHLYFSTRAYCNHDHLGKTCLNCAVVSSLALPWYASTWLSLHLRPYSAACQYVTYDVVVQDSLCSLLLFGSYKNLHLSIFWNMWSYS
jgi:hypothetical protein